MCELWEVVGRFSVERAPLMGVWLGGASYGVVACRGSRRRVCGRRLNRQGAVVEAVGQCVGEMGWRVCGPRVCAVVGWRRRCVDCRCRCRSILRVGCVAR